MLAGTLSMRAPLHEAQKFRSMSLGEKIQPSGQPTRAAPASDQVCSP